MNDRFTAVKHLARLLTLLVCLGLMMMTACSPAAAQWTPTSGPHAAEVCLKSGPGDTGPTKLPLIAQARSQLAALTTAKDGFRYKP